MAVVQVEAEFLVFEYSRFQDWSQTLYNPSSAHPEYSSILLSMTHPNIEFQFTYFISNSYSMFNLSDLNEKYSYDYSVKKSVSKFFPAKKLDKKNPYQLIVFINKYIAANNWEWDKVTFYICKRIEYLIQEELPTTITNKREISSWITKGWKK